MNGKIKILSNLCMKYPGHDDIILFYKYPHSNVICAGLKLKTKYI